MALFRPIASARRVGCPVLFVVGETDTITPTSVTLKAARLTRRAETLSLPGGHFDAYLGEQFERAVSTETAFFVKHLLTAQPALALGGSAAAS
jgi:fermentation-respiration switch protein FrsA (DUF1100 family)